MTSNNPQGNATIREILEAHHLDEAGTVNIDAPVAAIAALIEQIIGSDEPAKLFGQATELEIDQRLARNALRQEQRERAKGVS